ncbi:MAG: hypothetical protein GEV05_13165 [Betaproteobacteria bacterium]|nr:hypothetical protein [Betaproteobacteria bacterium]
MNLPVPALNADSKPFWEAARASRLLIKQCDACMRPFFPPRHLCPFCWSDKTLWIESRGTGTIYSYTVIHRAPAPEFSGRGPYVVALVDLAEGPRVMANIVGAGALEAAVGDRVKLCFEERGEGWKVPQFERSAS